MSNVIEEGRELRVINNFVVFGQTYIEFGTANVGVSRLMGGIQLKNGDVVAPLAQFRLYSDLGYTGVISNIADIVKDILLGADNERYLMENLTSVLIKPIINELLKVSEFLEFTMEPVNNMLKLGLPNTLADVLKDNAFTCLTPHSVIKGTLVFYNSNKGDMYQLARFKDTDSANAFALVMNNIMDAGLTETAYKHWVALAKPFLFEWRTYELLSEMIMGVPPATTTLDN